MYPNSLTSPQNVEPMPQMQSQLQPAKPKMDPRVRNTIIYCAVTGSIIVFGIIGIVLLLVFGRTTRRPSEPTMEVAKNVCDRYGGKMVDPDNARFGAYFPDEYFQSNKICERFSKNGGASYPSDIYIGSNDFSYEIGELKENKKDEYRSRLENSVINSDAYQDISKYIILEDSDDSIKACNSIAGMMVTCILTYKNMVVYMYSSSISVIDDVFAELGFPDRARLDSINDNNNGSKKEYDSEKYKVSQRDDQRRDDYSMLVTAVNSYLASNGGKINNIIKDADPQTLTASKWVSDTGEDPDGNSYDVLAYSFDKWASDGQPIPSNNNGSQVFVIIKANCRGVDADGDPMPASDTASRSFAVYGYLEEGHFCQASGSAL